MPCLFGAAFRFAALTQPDPAWASRNSTALRRSCFGIARTKRNLFSLWPVVCRAQSLYCAVSSQALSKMAQYASLLRPTSTPLHLLALQDFA